MKRIMTILLGGLIGVTPCFVGCVSQPRGPSREALLSLPWQEFDQTPNSGWRVYAVRQEYRTAVELIEDYLKQHQELNVRQRAVSHFHAGMLRVRDGNIQAGLVHLNKALAPDKTPGLPDDWNDMVNAHRAFLLGDRATLVEIKERVAGLPKESVEWPNCPTDLLKHLGEPYGSWEADK